MSCRKEMWCFSGSMSNNNSLQNVSLYTWVCTSLRQNKIWLEHEILSFETSTFRELGILTYSGGNKYQLIVIFVWHLQTPNWHITPCTIGNWSNQLHVIVKPWDAWGLTSFDSASILSQHKLKNYFMAQNNFMNFTLLQKNGGILKLCLI
jgi:hypothetical protein